MNNGQVICGDSLEVLRGMADCSVDAIITDPPYGIEFMGKAWDKADNIAFNPIFWTECARVLKPGGHLLAFGGARTYHRLACAVEDTGLFEIRDQIMWLYGQGFPKSMDISKAIAKTNTEEAERWKGWGTGLKPAFEPLCVARKIFKGTVANNVLEYGVGGLNIDGCRVGAETRFNSKAKSSKETGQNTFNNSPNNNYEGTEVTGRFPSNLILDDTIGELIDEQSGISKSNPRKADKDVDGRVWAENGGWKDRATSNYTDQGGASRFFYCAKPSKKERMEMNDHPTVKPVKLMEYLVTLVVPTQGLVGQAPLVLDPFGGSGTTALACINKGVDYILIDNDPHSVEIAKQRIERWEV